MKQDENEDIVVPSKDEKLNILFWNKFYYLEFFGMGVGNEGFVKNNCKHQNCYTTNQRKKLKTTIPELMQLLFMSLTKIWQN